MVGVRWLCDTSHKVICICCATIISTRTVTPAELVMCCKLAAVSR